MPKELTKTYRVVSDYGYGDKSWGERGLTAEKALKQYNTLTHSECTDVDQCARDEFSTYYIELCHR